MDKFEEVRNLYPGLKNQVYLDTPTSGLLSSNSYEAMKCKLDKSHFEGLSLNEYWNEWNHSDHVRKKVAEMINASDEEIFFGKDASDMINAFVANIDFPSGSNVIIPDISFPSTRNAWLNRECDGLKVRFVPNKARIVTTDEILSYIDEKTFAISICAVEPSTGYAYDLDLLSKVCSEKNIFLVIDTTQGLGLMCYDMEKTRIDVMISSTYKWMNNVFGLGIGYIRKELLQNLKPRHVGWTGIRDRKKDFSNLELTISETASRFETGGLNWIGLAGVEESIKTYLNLGKEDIQKYAMDMVQYLYDEMAEVKHFKITPWLPKENRSGIVYLEISDKVSITGEEFAQRGIRVHVSGNKVRIGLHFYNSFEDVKKLITILKNYN
ncbi:Selenocysteine lyase/Cysteine desulfurase [Acetoanaerobium noterae]|uniref:Selenocysteine lyase/Cysteine desulfurase n=1 Tax=Acetoanaerobium noterae TaxID=745369 RepID=A0A1T5CQR5_9FIRM|nr:aminotransferase class V-fold PLP-dependent enzyme [Acetoanaerobium noterae]SKB61764.1 Selenocysteine lyase/Cysteine desulfurase [Acetoanaerobium noterae]